MTTETTVKREKLPKHNSLLKITTSLERVTYLKIREVKMLKTGNESQLVLKTLKTPIKQQVDPVTLATTKHIEIDLESKAKR